MSFLKKLDLFKSVNPEHKDGTIIGTLLTLVSVVFIIFFFVREFSEYNAQRLTTRLFVQDYDTDSIPLTFDISFLKVKCENLNLTIKQYTGKLDMKKKVEGDGCRASARLAIEPTNIQLSFTTNFGTSMVQLMEHFNIVILDQEKNKTIDFSHDIHQFQLGKRSRNVKRLEKKFKDMIKANPLDGVNFKSKNQKEGHSLFLYEINAVNSMIGGSNEIIYNYNRNTINNMAAQPFVNFKLHFSPIAVEYIEGNESFFTFLTYILGVTGGILAIIKFIANVLGACFRRKSEPENIPS